MICLWYRDRVVEIPEELAIVAYMLLLGELDDIAEAAQMPRVGQSSEETQAVIARVRRTVDALLDEAEDPDSLRVRINHVE